MHAPGPRRGHYAMVGLFLGLLGPGAAAGQALAPLDFAEVERFRTAVPVGGAGLWGVIATDPMARVDVAALHVAIPPSGPRYLCLEVQTRDGRYRGEARYVLPREPGLRAVGFPTRHGARLSRYEVGHVGVRAFAADDCELSAERERIHLPVQWSDAREDGRYTVLMNAVDERTRLRLYHQEADRYFECAAMEGESRLSVVFDTRCELQVTPGTHRATLTVIRTRLGHRELSHLVFYFP